MAALGADLTIVPSVGGKITPDLTPRMIETAREIAEDPNVYWTDRLNNTFSLVRYYQVGVELLEQMQQPIDVFCCAVGTSGMATGVRNALDDADSAARVVIFEPDSSPVVSTGKPGSTPSRASGFGMLPPLLDPDRFNEVRAISEDDGFATARRLTAVEGLLAGGSTGLDVAGAIELAREVGPGKTVVTVACDTGLKYLSGGLYGR